jgi:hypothetical protein
MNARDLVPLLRDALDRSDYGFDNILGRIGLQQRRSAMRFVLPSLGIFVGGALVGAVAGVLLAPRSGEQMRRQLKNGIKNTVDHARETYRNVKSRVEDEIEEFEDDARA